MEPGHLGVALAAKPLAPKAPLWALLAASEALDLLCFGFVAIGAEHTGVSQADITRGIRVLAPGLIPWSHGLLMSLVWSLAAAGIGYLVVRDWRASGMLGLVVFSHWLLDLIVHLPDLPLFLEGSPKLGLGLWGTGPGLVLSGILEVALIAGGTAIYIASRKKANAIKSGL